jgi:hypothetical protein
MVTIPVFDVAGEADPEKYIRQFKRACMANGDCDEKSWLELLPIHLEDEATWWYGSQTALLMELSRCERNKREWHQTRWQY